MYHNYDNFEEEAIPPRFDEEEEYENDNRI